MQSTSPLNETFYIYRFWLTFTSFGLVWPLIMSSSSSISRKVSTFCEMEWSSVPLRSILLFEVRYPRRLTVFQTIMILTRFYTPFPLWVCDVYLYVNPCWPNLIPSRTSMGRFTVQTHMWDVVGNGHTCSSIRGMK